MYSQPSSQLRVKAANKNIVKQAEDEMEKKNLGTKEPEKIKKLQGFN
jgi:hypothetical protein